MCPWQTDFPNAPEETKCSTLPCGGFGPGGALLAWLEKDLAAVIQRHCLAARRASLRMFVSPSLQAAANRAKRPWIIVSGHRPVYSPDFVDAAGNPTGDCKNLQTAIEALLMKYGVDVYFAGHKHAYVRTFPVYNNVVTKSCVPPLRFPA